MLGFIGIKWLSQKVPLKWVPESSRTVPINPTSFSQGNSVISDLADVPLNELYAYSILAWYWLYPGRQVPV